MSREELSEVLVSEGFSVVRNPVIGDSEWVYGSIKIILYHDYFNVIHNFGKFSFPLDECKSFSFSLCDRRLTIGTGSFFYSTIA